MTQTQDPLAKEVRTFCRVCEPACGMRARVEDGELVALVPDRDHPVSKGFVCNKGIYGLDIHRDADRLRYPMRRNADGELERISWDVAMREIASRCGDIVERHGTEALGAYNGNPNAFNTLFGPSFGNFARQLGIPRYFGSGTQDCSNKFAASEAMFGTRTLHPIPDIERSDFILIAGENPAVSHMSFLSIPNPMAKLKEAEARGARVVFINPRRIESVTQVGQLLQIPPDTDAWLFAAMIDAIATGPGFSPSAPESAENLDALAAFCARYPAETVAEVVGVPADEIRRLALDFAAAPHASAHGSTGLNMGRQGTLAYWLLQMLVVVTGNFAVAGGNVYGEGFYTRAPASGAKAPRGYLDTPFGEVRAPGGVGITLPGNLMADYLLLEESPIRAMFVNSGNPVLSIGGEARMRRGMERLELLVCVDIYPNATSEYADYLLPAAGAFEREDINITGLGLQYDASIQFTEAVVQPGFERRPDWWIYERLCQAFGFDSRLDEVPEGETPDMWARINAMLASRGHSMEALRAEGVLTFERPPAEKLASEYLQTESKRVDAFPAAFAAALQRMDTLFAQLRDAPPALRLITKRDAYSFNSWYSNVEKLKHGTRDTNYLFMHPADAERRQIREGDSVHIRNEHGEITAPVRISDEVREGVVAMPHGWGQARTPGMRVAAANPGANCNALLPTGMGSFEPISSQAHMTGVPVEVAVA